MGKLPEDHECGGPSEACMIPGCEECGTPDVDQEVITHGGVDRGYKMCKCGKCHAVAECTPFNDYYTIANDSNGKLYCESCYRGEYIARTKGDIE
jgi:hypothetical protein